MLKTKILRTKKVLFPDLSYQITGILFDIHNELGRFAKEKQYANLSEIKFKKPKTGT